MDTWQSLLQPYCGIFFLSLSNGAGSLLKPVTELSRTEELVSYRAKVWVGASRPGLRSNHQGCVGICQLEIYCCLVNVLALPRIRLPLLRLGSH